MAPMPWFECRIKEGDDHVVAVEIRAETPAEAADRVAVLVWRWNWRWKALVQKVWAVAVAEDHTPKGVVMLFEILGRAVPGAPARVLGALLVRKVKT